MPLDFETYSGLREALSTPENALELDDVADDVAAEQETLTSPEVPTGAAGSTEGGAGINDELSRLQETLKSVSKGISDGTETEYKRYVPRRFLRCLMPLLTEGLRYRLMSSCDAFLRERGFLQDSKSLFSRHPRQEAPCLIVAWIMDT